MRKTDRSKHPRRRQKQIGRMRDAKLIEELVAKYGFTPLDVMLDTADWASRQARAAEKRLSGAKTDKDKYKAESKVRMYRSDALHAVSNAAPYMHARLQATELSNDPENPITTPDLVVAFTNAKPQTNNSDT